MFQDRTLNWSFAASICANLMLVSLLGGSDLFKTPPGTAFVPIRHLPFILTMPPPVTPEVIKPRPAATHVKPIAHSVAHPMPRTASPAHAPAKPMLVARLDVGRRVQSSPDRFVVDNGDQPVGDQSGEPDSAGTVAGPVSPKQIQHVDGYPTLPVAPQGTRGTQTAPPLSDAPKTTLPRPRLADRENPEQVGAWPDITTSVQFDQAALISSTIIVQFEVDTDGRASNVKVIKSSGNSDLDQNAIDACKAMRWKPAVQDGVDRSVTMTHEFDIIS